MNSFEFFSILFCIFCCLLNPIVLSFNLRSGSISSKPLSISGTNVSVEFQLSTGWKLSANNLTYCDDSYLYNQRSSTQFGEYFDVYCSKCNCNNIQIIANSSTNCISFSFENDWSYGQSSFSAVLPYSYENFIYFSGNNLTSINNYGTRNTGKGNWKMMLKLDTTVRKDTDEVNSSPITFMVPVLNLRAGFEEKFVLKVPFHDPNNDMVACRLAEYSKDECGGILTLILIEVILKRS